MDSRHRPVHPVGSQESIGCTGQTWAGTLKKTASMESAVANGRNKVLRCTRWEGGQGTGVSKCTEVVQVG